MKTTSMWKRPTLTFIVITALVCLVSMLFASGVMQTITTNVTSEATTLTVFTKWDDIGLTSWTDLISQKGVKKVLVYRSLTKEGRTNIVASYFVDGVELLQTVDTNGDGVPETFYLKNPSTKNVEGFRRISGLYFLPLSQSEMDKYRDGVKRVDQKMNQVINELTNIECNTPTNSARKGVNPY